LLLDPLPWQLAPLRAQLIAQPVELFLLGEQFFPLFNPFRVRYDFVIRGHDAYLLEPRCDESARAVSLSFLLN
jgi:hypothetical protein